MGTPSGTPDVFATGLLRRKWDLSRHSRLVTGLSSKTTSIQHQNLLARESKVAPAKLSFSRACVCHPMLSEIQNSKMIVDVYQAVDQLISYRLTELTVRRILLSSAIRFPPPASPLGSPEASPVSQSPNAGGYEVREERNNEYYEAYWENLRELLKLLLRY
jgi:hypothetical protein